MKKNPWVVIAVIQFFVIISLMSCSNNPLGVGEAGADPQQTPIAADKVMVNLSKTNMRDGARADEEISLQDYVNQTEPDLLDFLPGKTWTVKYKINGETKTGYISFNTDGSFQCDRYGGALVKWPDWVNLTKYTFTPISYSVSDNVLEFKYHMEGNGQSIDAVSYADFIDIKTEVIKTAINTEYGRSSIILTPQE